MVHFFDEEKTVEAIVYIAQSTTNLFHIVKILYFADKYHLQEFGRLITGDTYIAMQNGPVPSGAYDIIKAVRGDGHSVLDVDLSNTFNVPDNRTIIPNRKANLDYLSESELECLNKAIEQFAGMGISKLWKIVHDEPAYKEASENGDISFNSLVSQLDNKEQILEYLNS